jgi:hypothetical protein
MRHAPPSYSTAVSEKRFGPPSEVTIRFASGLTANPNGPGPVVKLRPNGSIMRPPGRIEIAPGRLDAVSAPAGVRNSAINTKQATTGAMPSA